VLIGFGLAGCSFPMVIGALGKLVPENWRGFAFGAGTAAGSFGQFLYSPLAAALIHAFSWQTTLLVFAGTILLVLPLSLALATPQSASAAAAAKPQSSRQALIEAFGHGSYVLLARISHPTKCIGAPNRRKLLCSNDFRAIRGAPRCRQSVAQICSNLHPLRGAK
jgi:MFS family permease